MEAQQASQLIGKQRLVVCPCVSAGRLVGGRIVENLSVYTGRVTSSRGRAGLLKWVCRNILPEGGLSLSRTRTWPVQIPSHIGGRPREPRVSGKTLVLNSSMDRPACATVSPPSDFFLEHSFRPGQPPEAAGVLPMSEFACCDGTSCGTELTVAQQQPRVARPSLPFWAGERVPAGFTPTTDRTLAIDSLSDSRSCCNF